MKQTYTASNICNAIDCLDKTVLYEYLNPRNHGQIMIVSVKKPEGPIVIRRRKSLVDAFGREESLSPQMIWRVANALNTGIPVNLDRILGASYNTRSVLESLLAYTPEIRFCYPGRWENIDGHLATKRGHKHIILSGEPHAIGSFAELRLGEDCVISEIPSLGMMYDVVPVVQAGADPLTIEIRRRHSQIQVALYEIAKSLDMRTWLAVEDHGIKYNGTPILQHQNIVTDLRAESTIRSFPDAIDVAKHIDCMYFNGGLPFAFEVEHTTGVTSGLTRMLNFRNKAEHLNTHYVIVAPDEDRTLVMQKSQPAQFDDIEPLYFPYSHVEDLYSFISRHGGKMNGVKKDFLLNFMEPCKAA